MIFNTWSFALFALIAITVYWTLIPQRLKPHYLTAIGCVFYVFSTPAYLAIIAGLGAATYFSAERVIASRANPHSKRAWLITGVTLVTGVLIFFKYTKLFAATVDQVAHHNLLPIPSITVPLAISFFTFEFVHVLLDVYLDKIERLDPLDFAAFSMFFPTLVAGPIKRYQEFAPQARHITPPAHATFLLNFYRVVLGLTKKFIIADSMTVLTQPILTPDANPYGRLDFIVAIFAYAMKIYFDFSGYSDIAVGIGALLGVRIPENFDRPYWSENITIFWRRWHISLSSWIRDYIFIPMGGSHRPPLVTAVNLLVSMAIAGLWHGAAWTFVVWGLWHGVGLAVHRTWSRTIVPRIVWLSNGGGIVRALSVVTTFVFVALGWVLFAAPSFREASITVQRAFSL